MEQDYQRFNMFLESIHSGTKIFKMYKSLAVNQKLIDLLDEIISIFRKHEELVTYFIKEKNVDPNESLSIGREFIVWLEKVKTQMKIGKTDNNDSEDNENDDFEICINSLKGIHMGSTKGIEFVHKYKELDTTILKSILIDYSHIYDKVSDFIITNYL